MLQQSIMMTITIIMNEYIIPYLIGTSSYTGENQSFWMAIQGTMIVYNTLYCPNHQKSTTNTTTTNQQQQDQQSKSYFYYLIMSILYGYSGGLFGFIWMGKPSAILTNDCNIVACIVAFCIIFILQPYGYSICNTIPIQIITIGYSQLFRTMGLIRFVKVCYNELKDTNYPTQQYYPIPIIGPILYGTLLGNMGGFVIKGIEGYVGNGMPWPFQNGLFCASFYHFYVHDTSGIIGITLRQILYPIIVYCNMNTMTNDIIATIIVSLFMQIMGILQMSIFLGPNFSPFVILYNIIEQIIILFILPIKQLLSIINVNNRQNHNNNNNNDQNNTTMTKTTNGTIKGTTTSTTNKNKKKKNKDL